jgi:predicted nucleic acid-binding protein
MAAAIKDIKAEPPENISFDANFLLRFFTRTLPELTDHNPTPYCDCIKHLIQKRVFCCVSDFVVEEICYKILGYFCKPAFDLLSKEDKYKYRNWAKFGEKNPQYLRPSYEYIDKIMKLFEENLIFIMTYEKNDNVCDDYISKEAIELIKTYDIVSNDAFIIAHSKHFGITNFLTLDEKWKTIDGITCYKW